ncbi:hypothetical protein HAX54_008586, partial [Datura stramonium]|nr:hypothetical protein [Datura stramonium]
SVRDTMGRDSTPHIVPILVKSGGGRVVDPSTPFGSREILLRALVPVDTEPKSPSLYGLVWDLIWFWECSGMSAQTDMTIARIQAFSQKIEESDSPSPSTDKEVE